MSKTKTTYICRNCAATFPKWLGKCPECDSWDSLEETTLQNSRSGVHNDSVRNSWTGGKSQISTLAQIQIHEVPRISSGMLEFDRVLGCGLVPGSIVLIGGDPGIGKSTILLQTMTSLAKNHNALYVSGEESQSQIAMRAKRLQLPTDKLKIMTEVCVEDILSQANNEKPAIMVIDSIQTIYTNHLQSAAGSVAQVRESTATLMRFAKSTNTCIFLVGHVTKEGSLAGPRVLEHMVDTVLYFEGESHGRFRLLRAIKNRFGAINELGVFAMTDKGLKEINNPSAIFLTRLEKSAAGSVIMATWEGTRPILVEVQALVDQSQAPNPRRISIGLDTTRLIMLLAVLHRHGGVPTFGNDVFLNVVGGVRVTETASDLALIAAIVSSLRNKPLSNCLLVFGEVGLSGEIRPVPGGVERIKEASKHGFTKAIVPYANIPKKQDINKNIQVIGVSQLHEAMEKIFEDD